MDERRDPQRGTQAARPPLAAATRLSPIQQAYGAYTGHAVACPACRDVDRTCGTADRLWKAYQEAGVEAYDKLSDETA